MACILFEFLSIPIFQQSSSEVCQRGSMVASAGDTDPDLAATQFTKNCVAYNIMEF
jgi:hypothetical protein